MRASYRDLHFANIAGADSVHQRMNAFRLGAFPEKLSTMNATTLWPRDAMAATDARRGQSITWQ